MAIVVLGTIVAFVLMLVFFFKEREFLFGIIMAILTACAAFLGTILLSFLISRSLPENMLIIDKAYETPIVALKDNNGVSRHFYLCSGYVDDYMYYRYAYETDRGYKIGDLKAENCYIVYTKEMPRIEKFTAEGFKHWTSWIYAFPYHEYYVLYVPEGTITTEFSISLE